MPFDQQDDFNVAIVGAGIAGLALAIGLHKNRIPFILYEEAPQHSIVGAGIGLGPNGLLAMDIIEETFRPKYEAICVGNKSTKDQNVFFEGLLCAEGLGKTISRLIILRDQAHLTFPEGLKESWYGSSSWGSPNYVRKSAHRKELLDILTSYIPLESVKFNKRLEAVNQQDDAVILKFADGEIVRASALVGAEGIESIVREHVLQPLYLHQIKPLYADSYCYRAVIPMDEAREILGDLTDTAKMYLGKDRMVVTYRVSGGAEFNFLHCVSRPNEPWPSSNAITEKVTHQEMLADFQRNGFDDRLIKLLEKARPIRWGLFHHLYTSTYYKGRVALLGDSAHASLPFQAAGAGQGLEDALILSSVLGKIKGRNGRPSISQQLQAALEAYDAVRRPRAQRQTEQSVDAALLLYFQDPQAGNDMKKVLERMQGERFDWLWFHDLRADVRSAEHRMEQSLTKESAVDKEYR